MERIALFMPEIKRMLRDKKYAELKDIIEELHPSDIAQGWSELKEEERNVVFRMFAPRKAIEVFEYLEVDEQKELIEHMESGKAAHLLDEMSADERADLFYELPKTIVKKMFALMKKEEVEDVKELLSYPENTAGGLMTTEFAELEVNLTARNALLKLQESQRLHKVETINHAFITDREHRLIGRISLQEIVIASPDAILKDIMTPVEQIKVNVNQDQEEVAKLFKKYDLTIVPVVNSNNILEGIITIDDIVDVIEKEATEDFYGMGKISGVEDAAEINYAEASVFALVKKRLIWLFILLLIGAFISGRLLKGYSEILRSVIILAAFIPMLMDSGGNAGAQSLALIVRGLAMGEIEVNQVFKILKKEILTGFITGFILSLVAVGCVFILQGFDLMLGFTVGLSLLAVVTISSTTGALLPLVFKRLGFDPAVAASPFITTVVDATCLVVYFEIARALMLKG